VRLPKAPQANDNEDTKYNLYKHQQCGCWFKQQQLNHIASMRKDWFIYSSLLL